ncbi:hypothetical protein J3F83DRAFT_639691 [Trichoderma novae-zelandiae]
MPSRHIFPTWLKDVQPGDETGEYYVTVCNLAFNTAWQELKDWLSASCPVDFIEVFPTSCSGWMRLKGKDNFEKALAHLRSERFKDRSLLFDSRNESETIKIRFKEISPKPKHSRRKRSARGNRSQKVPCETATPQHRRAQSPPCSNPWSRTDYASVNEAAERWAYEEFLALASLMFSTSLQSTLRMQYPASAFAYYQAGSHGGMAMDYYGSPYSHYYAGGGPAMYPRQAGPGSALTKHFDDIPDVAESALDYRGW